MARVRGRCSGTKLFTDRSRVTVGRFRRAQKSGWRRFLSGLFGARQIAGPRPCSALSFWYGRRHESYGTMWQHLTTPAPPKSTHDERLTAALASPAHPYRGADSRVRKIDEKTLRIGLAPVCAVSYSSSLFFFRLHRSSLQHQVAVGCARQPRHAIDRSPPRARPRGGQ